MALACLLRTSNSRTNLKIIFRRANIRIVARNVSSHCLYAKFITLFTKARDWTVYQSKCAQQPHLHPISFPSRKLHTSLVKVKILPIQATKALRVGTGIALPYLRPRHWRWGVGGQHHAPAALPPGKTRYPLYKRLGRSQGRSERVRKISPPPGFDPRTVQRVASHCTDWAIPAHTSLVIRLYLWKKVFFLTRTTYTAQLTMKLLWA